MTKTYQTLKTREKEIVFDEKYSKKDFEYDVKMIDALCGLLKDEEDKIGYQNYHVYLVNNKTMKTKEKVGHFVLSTKAYFIPEKMVSISEQMKRKFLFARNKLKSIFKMGENK